jgi:hypothetical protein
MPLDRKKRMKNETEMGLFTLLTPRHQFWPTTKPFYRASLKANGSLSAIEKWAKYLYIPLFTHEAKR